MATVVSTGTMLAVLAVKLLVPGGWGGAAWAVLVAGLVLGLPHGAVDHLVPAFVLGPRAPRLPLVVAAYAAVAVGTWLAFRSVPAVALIVFVAVSLLHFGAGEVAFDAERAGHPLRPDPVAVLATGGAVLVLPIVGDHATVAPIIALLVPGSSGVLPGGLTVGATGLVLTAVVVTVAARLRRHRYLAAAELVLLVAVGLLVPPMAAFGAYFGAWHAVRHVARLVAKDPANAALLQAGRLGRPLGRFALAAAAPTAVSVLAVLGLWALADGWRGFVTANLAVLAGLTVPHALLVAWWDRQPRGRPLSADATSKPADGRRPTS